VVYVSGTLGDSALALQLLREGNAPPPELAGRHHDPVARVSLGRELARASLATAMIDISDGLCADLGHILEESGGGARIETAALPLSAPFKKALAEKPHLLELAWSGGEDYELLFTSAPERQTEVAEAAARAGVAVTRIGTINVADRGVCLLSADGRQLQTDVGGFNHFARG
ncbi:MAG TPA: AIR synthase-related protein, partial [Desulfuromonadales bacterium]|nr:AIR synthase-related protein [Desulfuromonadales bacterium]